MEDQGELYTPEELDALDELYREDPIAFMEDQLKIQLKKGGLGDFKLKKAQRMLVEVMERQRKAGLPIRIIILKARQIGFSTVVEAYFFWWLCFHRHTTGLVIAHENEASVGLWGKFVTFLNHMDTHFAPKIKRKDEARGKLELGTDKPELAEDDPCYGSTLKIESAKDPEAGRSGTYQLIHASEVAFWMWSRTFTAVKQTIANEPGTVFVLESTANGATGQFYKDWKMAGAGETDFIPIFVAWFENEEYVMDMTEAESQAWDRFRSALAEAEAHGEDWKIHLHWKDDGTLKLSIEEAELSKLAIAKVGDEFHFGRLKWYRWALKNLCDNDEDKRSQEYPSTADESFLSTGRPVFNSRQIIALKEDAKNHPYQRYTIDEVTSAKEGRPVIVEDEWGELYVFTPPDPNKRYAIGADVAEGTENGDNNAAHVVAADTMEHCAVILDKTDPDIYGQKLYWLGMWYNEALLGVEKNSAGVATVLALEKLEYPNLWGSGWPFSDKEHGWRTGVDTRKPMITHLKGAIREGAFKPRFLPALEEMLTFKVNAKGKPEAERGKTDDLVLSAAIALQMREEAAGQLPYMGVIVGAQMQQSTH